MHIGKKVAATAMSAGILLGGAALTAATAHAEPSTGSLSSISAESEIVTSSHAGKNRVVSERSFHYQNEFWGVSRVAGSYQVNGETKTFDSGPLAVHMDYSHAIPADATDVHLGFYRNGSAQEYKSWDFSNLAQGNPYIHSSGTVFNLSVWLTFEE